MWVRWDPPAIPDRTGLPKSRGLRPYWTAVWDALSQTHIIKLKTIPSHYLLGAISYQTSDLKFQPGAHEIAQWGTACHTAWQTEIHPPHTGMLKTNIHTQNTINGLKNKYRSYNDGSVLKRVCRSPWFGSQHPQKCSRQIPGIQHPLLTYEVTKDGAQIHIKQT